MNICVHFKEEYILNNIWKRKEENGDLNFLSICNSFTGYTYKLLLYTGEILIIQKKGVEPSVLERFIHLNLRNPVHLSFDSFFQIKNI